MGRRQIIMNLVELYFAVHVYTLYVWRHKKVNYSFRYRRFLSDLVGDYVPMDMKHVTISSECGSMNLMDDD